MLIMTYKHAVLGETLELCRDAAKWFSTEKERLEKCEKERENAMDSTHSVVKSSC